MPKRTGGKVLPAVRPNLSIEAAYRARMDALIDEMAASLAYWLAAAYRASPPELAQDASPAVELRTTMRRLARRWQKRFDDAAPEMAAHFAKAAADRSDKALAAILRRSGMTVRFKLTAAANDAVQATIGAQVELIRSIASEHLADVEQVVMRSVQTGRDLAHISRELQARHGVTKRRAALIARDQSSKATATITRVRQQELGITEAVWLHSSAGRHPRPEHVAASGKRYAVDKGMFLEGKWTWPGVEINCRCVAKSVLPGL